MCIVDYHPLHRNIVYAAGFSGDLFLSFHATVATLLHYFTMLHYVGEGFKLAPVIGQMCAEMAAGKERSLHVKQFDADRFIKSKM